MRPGPAKEKLAPLEPAEKPRKIEFDVELMTPLFGGGAIPREVDKISWLRSASVKSAIRAWWRIGSAHHFKSLADMREREDALFGAQGRYDKKNNPIGGQGMLSVVVKSTPIATRPYQEPVESPLNGAYFPALPMKRPTALLGVPGSKTQCTVTLTVKGRPSELGEVDVQDVLFGVRLWLTLGGAGARTRRSAGALTTSDVTAKKLDLPTTEQDLKSFLRRHCLRTSVADELDGVFCLARTRMVLVGEALDDATDAHKELLRRMRDARQDRKHPPDWKRGDWGRSRWPEPDAIRLKAARSRDGSEWSHKLDPKNDKRYPRAALGLPIVVYFMTKPDKPHEPPGHHIYGAKKEKDGWLKIERYASPILLRVVRVWRNEKAKFVPVALFTDCTLTEHICPLVTKKADGSVDVRDLVQEFEIQRHAAETLDRVAQKFLDAGFVKL